MLVEVITVAAIVIVAPHLAATMLPAIYASGGFILGATSAAIGASLDTLAQFAEVKVGIKSRFSINEVIETAFTAGTLGYSGIANTSAAAAVGANTEATATTAAQAAATTARLTQTMMLNGISTVGSQLTEMLI